MRYKSLILILLLFASSGYSQITDSMEPKSRVFSSVDDLISFATDNSLDLENNKIYQHHRYYRQSPLCAVSKQYQIRGQPFSQRNIWWYTGYFSRSANFNPNGYNNVKLADINIALTKSNNLLSLKQYQDNLVANYYNIINIQKQIQNTEQNIATSDSLLAIVNNKYEEGLIKQQDVNDTKINHLQIEETYRQLNFLQEQYYLSLKTLTDIPEKVNIEIVEKEEDSKLSEMPNIRLNKLGIENAALREKYAKQSLMAAKQSFLPTVSFQFSNSWNLFNTEFKPLSGNWINSNYFGLKLNIPIPNSQQIANKYNAQFDFEIAANNTLKEKNETILEVKKKESEYLQAQSQIRSNKEILHLQKDTYAKNLNLYEEGIVSIDLTIQSLNAVIAAEYNLITSISNLELVNAKINVNNKALGDL